MLYQLPLIFNKKTTEDLMAVLSWMYEKPSATKKVHLIKKLFNLKMSEGGVAIEYINNFNSLISQLESVRILFDEEFKALALLSSLPRSWNSLVVALSNSIGLAKLNMDHVAGLVLSEDIRRKDNGESSSSALAIDDRGRKPNKGNNKKRSTSKSRNGRSPS